MNQEALHNMSNWEVNPDSFAPQPQLRRKPWDRAPVSAHASRLHGQTIWKRAGQPRPTKTNDKNDFAQIELERDGAGARKKARTVRERFDTSDAQWKTCGLDEELEASNHIRSPKKQARKSLGTSAVHKSLLIPRKRTNANHLVTPRKSSRRQPLADLAHNTGINQPCHKSPGKPQPSDLEFNCDGASRKSPCNIYLKDATPEECAEKSLWSKRSLRKSTQRLVRDTAEQISLNPNGHQSTGKEMMVAEPRTSPRKTFSDENQQSNETQPIDRATPENLQFELKSAPEVPHEIVGDLTPIINMHDSLKHSSKNNHKCDFEPSGELVGADERPEGSPKGPSPTVILNCQKERPITIFQPRLDDGESLMESKSPEEESQDLKDLACYLSSEKEKMELFDEVDLFTNRRSLISSALAIEDRALNSSWANNEHNSDAETSEYAVSEAEKPGPIPGPSSPSKRKPRSKHTPNSLRIGTRIGTRRNTRNTHGSLLQSETSSLGDCDPAASSGNSIPGTVSTQSTKPFEIPVQQDEQIPATIPNSSFHGPECVESLRLGEPQVLDVKHAMERCVDTHAITDGTKLSPLVELAKEKPPSGIKVHQQTLEFPTEESLPYADEQNRTEVNQVISQDMESVAETIVTGMDAPGPDQDTSSPTRGSTAELSPVSFSPILEYEPDTTFTVSADKDFENIDTISLSEAIAGNDNTLETDALSGSPTKGSSVTGPTNSISKEKFSAIYDHDDTDMLRNFLTRVKANKEAKAKLIPRSQRSLPHSPLHLPLSDTSANSPPSPQKDFIDFDVSLPSSNLTKQGKRVDLLAYEEENTGTKTIRRSSRTRIPVKAVVAVPSFIPVRRLGQDSDSTITLRRSEEKELAALTRINTRKNKAGALAPVDVLAKRLEEKEDPAARHKALKEAFDEKSVRRKSKKGKIVVWAEELTRFQEDDLKKSDAEDELMEKETGEKGAVRVGVRSSRVSMGMVLNGTPAPKRKKKRS